MSEDKECVQLLHPAWQTDCFKDAGGRPCSADTCAVVEAMETDVVFRMTADPDARESAIRCRLLHYVCRMSRRSPDNSEYWERIKS